MQHEYRDLMRHVKLTGIGDKFFNQVFVNITLYVIALLAIHRDPVDQHKKIDTGNLAFHCSRYHSSLINASAATKPWGGKVGITLSP